MPKPRLADKRQCNYDVEVKKANIGQKPKQIGGKTMCKVIAIANQKGGEDHHNRKLRNWAGKTWEKGASD